MRPLIAKDATITSSLAQAFVLEEGRESQAILVSEAVAHKISQHQLNISGTPNKVLTKLPVVHVFNLYYGNFFRFITLWSSSFEDQFACLYNETCIYSILSSIKKNRYGML